jgi:hypothetical protein
VAGGRIAYGRVVGRRGRPEVVVRRLDGRGPVVRWRGPRGRQAGPTGLDLARGALAIGWATSSPGGRAATQVWLRARGRTRRLDGATVGSGRWLTAPVLDGSWLVWGDSCASGELCRAPRLRRSALRGGRRGTASPPALAPAAIALDRGHAFALVGAGPTVAEGCGDASTGRSCRVLDLGRPFR